MSFYLIICNYEYYKLIIVDVFGGKINKFQEEKCNYRLKMNAKGIKNKATSSGSGNASFSKKFKYVDGKMESWLYFAGFN